MNTPNGLDEIVATFGDVHSYVDDSGILSPAWNRQFLSVAELPFPLALSWNPNVTVYKITCHRLLAQTFVDVFNEIKAEGLQDAVTTFGGCFNFRPQRSSAKLSTHAWGIAIDLNTADNAQGTIGSMEPGVVQAFRDAGFEWGGMWDMPRTDPQHFQYCVGY